MLMVFRGRAGERWPARFRRLHRGAVADIAIGRQSAWGARSR
jgi:hypothetical protein